MPDIRDLLPPPPWEGPPIPEAFMKEFALTPERIQLIQEINNQIRRRTSYGIRTEEVTKLPAYMLMWSNYSASWHSSWAIRGKRSVELDANYVLVQRAKRADIDAIVKWLEPLPLYAYSFEAKGRGIYNPLGHLQALLESWLRGELRENES